MVYYLERQMNRVLEQKTKCETHSKPYLVNLWQTQEHRREKYWLLRSLGCNIALARQRRDWRLTKIERAYNLITPRVELAQDGRIIQPTTE